MLDNESDVFVRPEAAKIPPVNEGDILITAANGSSKLVGKRARISKLPARTVHGGFMLLARPADSEFLNASMGTEWYGRFLTIGVAGGNGALGNLDKAELEKTDVPVPVSATEQRLIGAFFRDLDDLITLHQRKLECLD